MLWLLPIYVVSFLLNGDWYQEIAVYAYKAKQSKEGSDSVAVKRMRWDMVFARCCADHVPGTVSRRP